MHKGSLYVGLLVAFLDSMGFGMIYPLFSIMLFDPSVAFVSNAMSLTMRGLLLGILLSTYSIAQFFSAPFWGTLSDAKGRKSPLQYTLLMGVFGYALSLVSIAMGNVVLLFISRIFTGLSSGNISIIQAAFADLSTSESKAKNFGFINMASGLGFTLGPFFGGFFSVWNYYIPFVFAFGLTSLNLIFAVLFFKETLFTKTPFVLNWKNSFTHIKKAFDWPGLKIIFISAFFYFLSWTIYIDLLPVFLMKTMHASSFELGIFYGIAGAAYAFGSGALIGPLSKRIHLKSLYFFSMVFAGVAILFTLVTPTLYWLLVLVAILSLLIAITQTVATTIVSNCTAEEVQGEALGIMSSVAAFAQMATPLVVGSFIGAHPTLAIWGGSISIFLGASVLLLAFGKILFYWKV